MFELPKLTCDASDDWWTRWRLTQGSRYRFASVRRAENQYAIQLRRIAAAVDAIVRGFAPAADEVTPDAASRIIEALNRYASLIQPWSQAVAARMLADVSSRDMRAWRGLSREMGQAVRREIAEAPTGHIMRAALAEQVNLITSLPLEAAQRVHQLITEGIAVGRRAKDIADEIMRSGEVTRSRANLIARTEIGRTAFEFTKARAQSIGSEGYHWATAKDRDVRPAHRKLEGKFIRWDDPPVASEPGQKVMRYHAGAGPNCRCTQLVVIPSHFYSRAA